MIGMLAGGSELPLIDDGRVNSGRGPLGARRDGAEAAMLGVVETGGCT